MRFMMIMIPAVYDGPTDPNFFPPLEEIEKMDKYNAALAKAGVLLTLEGLMPPEKGARVRYKGGKPTVTDGPFTESKEVVGGYWLIQVKSRDEAIEWARRVPAAEGDIVELRQLWETTDFPPDVQAAADSATVRDAVAAPQKH